MPLLRIELLESCKPVSQKSYNAFLNEDVFYDSYGLPYLPAWLVKFTHIETRYTDGIENRVRVLNRGLIFEEYFTLDDRYAEDFAECVRNFTSLTRPSPAA